MRQHVAHVLPAQHVLFVVICGQMSAETPFLSHVTRSESIVLNVFMRAREDLDGGGGVRTAGFTEHPMPHHTTFLALDISHFDDNMPT